MNEFRGTGAECMVQFNKDGCKGAISIDRFVVIDRAIFEADGDNCKWALDWLTLPCVYCPPDPIYRNVTPGEALEAWLSGVEVYCRYKNEPDKWSKVAFNIGYTWQFANYFDFRVKQD